MANPVPVSYSALAGDRVYGGRVSFLRDPSAISFTWPPGANCVIPNAEGVNAPIHPKVLDTGSPGWNGYRYWMAYTPYPKTDGDIKENPCVVASADGDTWVEPAPNPIEPAPPGVEKLVKYNSDTHLVLYQGVLHLIWRLFDNSTNKWIERLLYRTTSDGVNWSAAMPMNIETQIGVSKLLSPSVEFFNGQWWCWTFNRSATPVFCLLRTAPSIAGPWSTPQACSLQLPDNSREPWHLDVTRIPNGWAMLISDRARGGSQGWPWLAYSKDGVAWTVGSTPFATGSPQVYRSCLLRTTAGFDCWMTDWDSRKIRRMSVTAET